MSNMPPPLPPQMPQQYGYAPEPAPKKKLGGCAIAAIVVGVIIGLLMIGTFVGGYVLIQKVGGRGGVAKAAIAMANPDYEILEFDEKTQELTVRHKKTGKSGVVPISHLKNGRIEPEELGLTEEQASGTGNAPDWVRYPGSKIQTSAQVFGMTTLILETTDALDDVMAYYEKQTGDRGVKVSARDAGSITATDGGALLKISMVAQRRGSTMITVVYKAK